MFTCACPSGFSLGVFLTSSASLVHLQAARALRQVLCVCVCDGTCVHIKGDGSTAPYQQRKLNIDEGAWKMEWKIRH